MEQFLIRLVPRHLSFPIGQQVIQLLFLVRVSLTFIVRQIDREGEMMALAGCVFIDLI
jgi:hypothetical protein